MEKLLLIDGNSMLFRAYYATVYGSGNMSTSDGIPTNAIYGFALMLQKALKTIEPQYVFVAFDHSKATYRHKEYPEYKGTRSATPEDLKTQFPIIREYLDALHIVHLEKEGLEADDIIGSLAKQNKQYDVNVLTSDKDLLQIVDDNIKVWLMHKGITDIAMMDEAAVYERFTLKPLQIIDLKGLSGDPSDNIPGVTKVGDKTAIKLLTEYESVEGVYQHIDELKGKLKENLVNDKDKAFLSKRLATIIVDADLSNDVTISDCSYQKEGKDAYMFYTRYQMKSLANRIDLSTSEETTEVKQETKQYKSKGIVSLSKITSDLLVDNTAIYVDEDGMAGISNSSECGYMAIEELLANKQFVEFLESDKVKIFYDIKAWHHIALKNGFSINGKNKDLMIEAFLLDSSIKQLDDLLVKYDLAITNSSSTQLDLFSSVDGTKSAEVADKLLYLADVLEEQLKEKNMMDLYYDVELPLALVLAEMEFEGVRVNVDLLDKIADKTQEKINVLEKSIYDLAGKKFNINSPKQLGAVIYDDLALARSTKRSTDAKVLGKLINTHPIIGEILEYRKYAKLYSTYAFGLKKYIEDDGKIHTKFNQCITETGRLSSSDPNLQNISVRNEETSEIRAAFVPEEGCVLVGADYSQIELRLLAHLSKEEGMIEAFKAGVDAHTKTAMDIFGVEEKDVTSLMRRQAKAINFGIDYGMSAFGLSESLGVSVGEAANFINEYFKKYPKIKQYMDDAIVSCTQKGYITTMLNRRREIPEINSSNHNIKEFGKRAAMNAPVQGSAADLIKVAMIKVAEQLKKQGLKSKLILQIHDELILNVPIEETEKVMKLVEKEMENAMELSVPLVAKSTSGSNWLEVK